MSTPLPLLDRIEVASPCSTRWSDMEGDDRRRFCRACRLTVHDLSAYTRDEAEALIQSHLGEGKRFCGMLRRRADGTILTRDCPVGRARLRRRARWAALRAAALLGFATGAVATVAAGQRHDGGQTSIRRTGPVAALIRKLRPKVPLAITPLVPGRMAIAGEIALPVMQPIAQPVPDDPPSPR